MWGWSGAVSITCMKLVKSVNAVSGTSWSLYGYHLLKEETWNDWGLSHEWSAETLLFCLASLWDGLDYNNFSLVTDWACSSRCSREWGEVKGNPDPISLPPLIEDGANWFQGASKVTTQLLSHTLDRIRQTSKPKAQPQYLVVFPLKEFGLTYIYREFLLVESLQSFKQLVTSLARISGNILIKAETPIGFILHNQYSWLWVFTATHTWSYKDYKEIFVNPCPQFIAQD